jgi:hypothetical protein
LPYAAWAVIQYTHRHAIFISIITYTYTCTQNICLHLDLYIYEHSQVVDTHCHMQLEPLYSSSDDIIVTAQNNHIAWCVVCGVSPLGTSRTLFTPSPLFPYLLNPQPLIPYLLIHILQTAQYILIFWLLRIVM